MKIYAERRLASVKNGAERCLASVKAHAWPWIDPIKNSVKKYPDLWIAVVFGTIIGVMVAKIGR